MDKPFNEMFSSACDSLRELCSYAKEKGVTVLLQNVSHCISGMTPNSGAVAEILEHTGCDELGLSINTCAVFAGHETLENYFNRFGTRIKAIQLSDNDNEDEQLVLGDGKQDIALHLDTLEKYCFEGPITLEVTTEEDTDDPDGNYTRALEELWSLWN